MIKAIIFDCWNTVFYTDLKPHPFAAFAEKIGRNIQDYDFLKIFEAHFMLERYSKVEIPINAILNELKILPNEKLQKELKLILEEGFQYIKAYPETVDILEKLKRKYKLGMITNTDYLGFQALEKRFDLNRYFDVVLKSYETSLLKPNARIFELVLKRLNVRKDEVLMVGDSLKDDVEAAEHFGIRAVLIDRKNKYPDYSKRITSLNDLQRFL